MVNKYPFIVYYNKEKMEDFKPLFTTLKDEIGVKLTNNYFSVPCKVRIKEAHGDIAREFNHIMNEVCFEHPDFKVIFAFNV